MNHRTRVTELRELLRQQKENEMSASMNVQDDPFTPDPRFAPVDFGPRPIPEDGSFYDAKVNAKQDASFDRGPDGLMSYLENPDTQSLIEANVPNAAELRQEAIAHQFLAAHADYLRTASNMTTLIAYLAERHISHGVDVTDDNTGEVIDQLDKLGVWNLKNLNEAYEACLSGNLLELPEGSRYRLSADDLLVVSRWAQRDWTHGVAIYCARSRGLNENDMTDAELSSLLLDMVEDPAWRETVDDAAYFVWCQITPTFRPTPEGERFLREYYPAGRPLTMALLNAGFEALKQQGAAQLANKPPTIDEMERMDDSTVSSLYTAALQERGHRMADARRTTPVTAEEAISRVRQDGE